MTQSTSNEVQNVGQLGSIQLPQDWTEGPQQSGGIGFRYTRPFVCPANNAVRICLFYRGVPLAFAASRHFRSLLAKGPQVLFRDGDPITQKTSATITEIGGVLDNASNNQVVNQEQGLRGHQFFLKVIEVVSIADRNVLSVKGWYRDADTNKRLNSYWGIFLDGKSDELECPVQEIYFEAPSDDLFQDYAIKFKEALTTIKWRQKG